MIEMRAQVVFDERDKVIKISSSSHGVIKEEEEELEVVGKFGTSLLYHFQGYKYHPRAIHILSNIETLKFRQDDVLLTMFPKSGSTWLSECIYLITNYYNFEKAGKDSIEYRFPQIDSPSHDVFNLILDNYDQFDKLRLIKASIPPNLMVEYHRNTDSIVRPRVISIIRNPRDVLVSFYHHCKTVKHYDTQFSFDTFFDLFVSGNIPCGPIWKFYNEMLDYHKRNLETSMIVYFEDMKKDMRSQILKICKFLNKDAPNLENEWIRLLDHLSVEKMRNNNTINRHDWTKLGLKNENGFEFVRKGQVNDWKNFFNNEHIQKFEEIFKKLDPELQIRYSLS